MTFRSALMTAAMSSLFCIPHAQAQSTSDPAPDPSPQRAETGTVREILVTAQRRTERLQDVPIAVVAVTGDALQDAGVKNLTDVGQLVPNLTVSTSVGQAITYLRGVGTSFGFPTYETPVAVYVDGIYYASAQSLLFDLPNVDRLEVLKGPQGTLFGRNATGGLIQIFTREPGQELKASANISYGNYETIRGDAYIGGPITDTLSADLTVAGNTMGEGWGTNLFTGTDANRNFHTISVRSKWVFRPTDRTKITLIGDFTDQEGSLIQPRIPRGSVSSFGVPVRGDYWDVDTNIDSIGANRNYGASLKIEQDLGFANLMNQVGFRHARSRYMFDLDVSPVPFLHSDPFDDEQQFSEELQLSSVDGSNLQWTAGVFYFKVKGAFDPLNTYFTGGPELNPVFPLTTFLIDAVANGESISGYAQGTYEFLPRTNLTLGVRYTHESYSVRSDQFAFLADGTPIGNIASVPKRTASENKPTFRVALDHRFSPEVLAYASFNTGFKRGGFNMTGFDPPFEAETVSAYETGLKTDLFDRRLRLNLAAFYYDYRNIQISQFAGGSSFILNGPRARNYGAEADFEAVVTDDFRVTGSLGYLNAKYVRYPNHPSSVVPEGGIPLQPRDVSGNDLIKSPRFQSSLNLQYSPSAIDGLQLNGTWQYNSGFYVNADNVVRQPAFSRFNASVFWAPADTRINVRLWANNITNEAVLAYGNNQLDGTHYVNYEAPRTYGITLGFQY